MGERIQTLHPDEGKVGVNIERHKYESVRDAILAAIAERGQVPFKKLAGEVTARLPQGFDGSVGWYTTTVKLDLEARGLIERLPGKSPQVLQMRKT
jgi:hypothetical protein